MGLKVESTFNELETGIHTPIRLNDTHRAMYVKDHKLVHQMNDHTDYHHHFLSAILTKISATGL
jgi:hypothetical protein